MSFLKIIKRFYGIRTKNTKLEGDQTVVAAFFHTHDRKIIIFSCNQRTNTTDTKQRQVLNDTDLMVKLN